MSEEETAAVEPIEEFVAKAHDLEAARGSVAEAASVTTGLWLSYLFVLVYIAIAAGAVTHKDLFLENPVKLPFVSDLPLPLAAFFILAPIVFIVSHADTLQLKGASLDGAFLWRAGLDVKSADAIQAQGLMWEPSWKETTPPAESKPWNSEAFLALKTTVEKDVPAGDTRAETLKRVVILDPSGSFLEGAKVPDWRKKFEAAASLDPEKYKQALFSELKALACSGDADALYVVRGLTIYGRIKDTGGRGPPSRRRDSQSGLPRLRHPRRIRQGTFCGSGPVR